MRRGRWIGGLVALAALIGGGEVLAQQSAVPYSIFDFHREFPLTDFARRSVSLSEIFTGGPRRSSFPTIYEPEFVSVVEALAAIDGLEPVLSIEIDGEARAYPLRIMLFHEIVNDVVGEVPVLVTYCPLCNSGVVFDRRLDGQILTFGNTGRLRHYDMVIYDHGTESFWQQFLGQAIIGARTGQQLQALPARLESLGRFFVRAPAGKVLVPNDPSARPYGRSGNAGTDAVPPALARERYPFPLPDGISPLERLVVVGDEAWALARLQEVGRIESENLILTWEPGQNSIHDTPVIAEGADVGNVVVQRIVAGRLEDVPYDVAFAYAFSAFVPEGVFHLD